MLLFQEHLYWVAFLSIISLPITARDRSYRKRLLSYWTMFRNSFICQGTSTRGQRRGDLFGLRVKLPPVTTRLTTQT